jgi:hypothetical protein
MNAVLCPLEIQVPARKVWPRANVLAAFYTPPWWATPKLFEQAPFFLKDRTPDWPNRLIAIYSYLFLSVPIFEG